MSDVVVNVVCTHRVWCAWPDAVVADDRSDVPTLGCLHVGHELDETTSVLMRAILTRHCREVDKLNTADTLPNLVFNAFFATVGVSLVSLFVTDF